MKTRCFLILIVIILLNSCSSTKNTSGTRWYHSFNTRYNVYFNGSQAFDEAFKTQLEGYTENYSEMIMMYPVSSLPKEKDKPGGTFDKAIEKAVKAIKMHSIQTRPERKQGKRSDPAYREFLNRKEYNPFLHNAWMLMAKSQFYNGDFLEAASSFSYISRLYETQPEIANTALLYKARCYDEMGWFYDADNILSKLPAQQLTRDQKKLYSSFNADHLIKQKQYAEAIPYLKASIKSGNNKLQRTREKYLLGQLYTVAGQKELAYKSFGEVSSSNAPYILELSAKIRQTEVYPGGDINKMSRKLNQMASSSKNADYLDQIYYAQGNVYMAVPDTAKAIKSYELGVEKSTKGGIEKALNQIKLGDIYFDRQEYVKAQPNYSDALAQLKKDDDAYPRVSKRSEVLDALVVHVQAVELQDSLQRLSRMTEDERMAVVNKIIADLIKKEKEDQKKAQQEQYQANQNALQEQMQANRPTAPAVTNTANPQSGSSEFYFYNQQVVAIGKTTFQQKWGRRNLEDDWRRKNKSSPLSFDTNDNFAANDTIPNDTIRSDSAATAQSTGENANASTDPHDPQFYLQQIPVTPDELAASDLIIANGLFNMGVIYKDMLEDNPLSLKTFQTLDTRFPDNENREKAYYYMYLIYWQDGNMDMANLYKAKIREGFPKGDLAIAMADPDYEYNQKRMEVVQDSLYQQTYSDYLAGNSMDVRKNYQWVSSKYSQSKLMPKFTLLNALTFAQTNEPDTFKVLLKGLIDKYPKEDVSALASDMMKGFQKGLLLSASGDKMLAQGSLFNVRFGDSGEAAASDSTLQFSTETATPYVLLLMYPKGSVDENLLLFTVAGYNFGNFMISDFGLEKSTMGNVGTLRITGFNNQDEVMQYLNKIQQPDGYAQDLGQAALLVPISEGNYNILMKGKSMDEYMTFFEKHFTQGNESMIAQWRLNQEEEKKVSKESEEKNLLTAAGDETDESAQSPETVLPVDTTQTTFPADTLPKIAQVDTVHVAPADSLSVKAGVTSDEVVESVNKIYNEASDKANEVSNTLNEIASDPVRGIANLFKNKKKNNAIEEFAKQQEREDKAQQAQLKKEQAEKDKAAKILAAQQDKEQKEALKKKAEEDKAALKTKQQEQSDLAKKKETDKKQKDAERKQKEADRKKLAKEKKEAQAKAQKQKKEDQKAKDKARKEDQKRKAKAREELRKQKDAERKLQLEQQQKKQVKK